MGKIGDLWVRLGLKGEDYKKGIDDAKKQTQGFGASLGKIKAGAVAVWAAIGTAVVGFAKEMIDGTNRIGDAWNRTTAQMKAGWDVFIQSVSTWNWDNFIGRIKESASAAKDLQNALDAEFEVSNSIKLQKSMMSEELAQLQIDMRNQNKSYEERAEAAKKYLDKVRPLYEQEIQLRKDLMEAYSAKWLAGSGLENSEEIRKYLQQFLVDYGKDANLIKAVADYNNKNSDRATWEAARSYLEDYGKRTGNYAAATMANVYETMRGDKDTVPLVQSIVDYYNSLSALDTENRRIYSSLHSSLSALGGDIDSTTDAVIESQQKLENAKVSMAESLPALAGIAGGAESSTMPDLIPDDWLERNREKIDAVIAEKQRLMDAGQMLADALTYGTTNALDELANAIAGVEGSNAGSVVKALLTPLADAAVQAGLLIVAQGTAVEAFKKSLMSLQGIAAIAAGTALIAIGTAAKAGLARIGSSAGSSGTAVSSSYNSEGYGSYRPTVESQEMTIYIKGMISGSDIILAEDRTRKKMNR